jgi:hypothetical protein
MKSNLVRRIEELERIQPAITLDRKAIAYTAFCRLQEQVQKEQFLGALGAEFVGRKLTRAEHEAKQKYLKQLAIETKWKGYASSAGFEYTFDPWDFLCVAARTSDADLGLAKRSELARKAGEEPTPEEAAAELLLNAELERLRRVALGLELPIPPRKEVSR